MSTDHIININLGISKELITPQDPGEFPNNLLGVHRHPDPDVQRWGNFCSSIVTHIANKSSNGYKLHWYHKIIFDFCYKQYDKYGDYYVVINNTYGTYEHTGIREVL